MRPLRWLAALALLLLAPAFLAPARAEDAAEPDLDEIRGYVGYTPVMIQRLEEADRAELKFSKAQGIGIARVLTGGPAAKAGLAVGDVLLEINGTKVPDTSAIGPKDDEPTKAYMKDQLGPITQKVRPGDKVVLVVDRAGKSVTIEAIAVDRATATALRQAEIDEEVAVKVPPPEGRGAATAAKVDFETLPEGESLPAGFLSVTGYFSVREEDGQPSNHVLFQDNAMGEEFAVLLLVADGRVYGNAQAKVRWAPLGGEKSVSAGLVLRAQDRKNFLAVRADGVGKNLRVYAVRDGKPTVLASTDMASPKLEVWHTLEVTSQGSTVKAVFDGTTTVEAKEVPWASGWSGIATWGDAVSAFDDLELTPTK